MDALTITVSAKKNGEIDFANSSTGVLDRNGDKPAELKPKLQGILRTPTARSSRSSFSRVLGCITAS